MPTTAVRPEAGTDQDPAVGEGQPCRQWACLRANLLLHLRLRCPRCPPSRRQAYRPPPRPHRCWPFRPCKRPLPSCAPRADQPQRSSWRRCLLGRSARWVAVASHVSTNLMVHGNRQLVPLALPVGDTVSSDSQHLRRSVSQVADHLTPPSPNILEVYCQF